MRMRNRMRMRTGMRMRNRMRMRTGMRMRINNPGLHYLPPH